MKKDQISENLPGYVLGVLDDEENGNLEHHLTECRDCRWELEQFQALEYLLAKTTPAMEPASGLRGKVIARVVGAAAL
ncbi:MAG: zf-HC2 domain-containing protein [Anaerolineaceae bacterium]